MHQRTPPSFFRTSTGGEAQTDIEGRMMSPSSMDFKCFCSSPSNPVGVRRIGWWIGLAPLVSILCFIPVNKQRSVSLRATTSDNSVRREARLDFADSESPSIDLEKKFQQVHWYCSQWVGSS